MGHCRHEQWKIREAEFGTKLYFESGVLGVSRGLTPQATASRAVFDKLKIPYEILKRDELTKRWPQVATEDSDVVGFYQPRGGTLKAHASCVAVASTFEKKGGRLVLAKASLRPNSKGNLQSVTLSSGETVSASMPLTTTPLSSTNMGSVPAGLSRQSSAEGSHGRSSASSFSSPYSARLMRSLRLKGSRGK